MFKPWSCPKAHWLSFLKHIWARWKGLSWKPRPDITEVRPEVRFRRFCHRAPTESQLLRDTLQFGLLVSSFLSNYREGAVFQERLCGFNVPKRTACKELLPAPGAACTPPLWASWLSDGKPGSSMAGNSLRGVHIHGYTALLHRLPEALS